MDYIKGLVSIMMPVYNGQSLILASIESLKKQTYTNWECIIIDDGSTDSTPEIVDSIKDSRFVVRHQPNGGRPVARQHALDLARGEYIAMLDAEDLYHPHKLESQVRVLKDNPDIVAVTTSMCSFGTKTEKLYVRGSMVTTKEVFNGSNHPTHAPSLLRASIAKKCTYNKNLKLGEDVDFLEKYLNIGDTYIRMNDIMYYYSELDSVSKYKIRHNYYLYIFKYLRERNVRRSLVFLLKYLYSVVVFPFVSIDAILAKRGRVATENERKEFEDNCLSIIRNVNHFV